MGKGKIVGKCELCGNSIHEMNISKSIISAILLLHSKCFYDALQDKGYSRKRFSNDLEVYKTKYTLPNDTYLSVERRFIEKAYRRIKYSNNRIESLL